MCTISYAEIQQLTGAGLTLNGSLNEIAAAARAKLAEIAASDIAENEICLISLLKARGVSVKRGRQKGPTRYTVQMKNATFGPVTLLKLEGMARKLAPDDTSSDQA